MSFFIILCPFYLVLCRALEGIRNLFEEVLTMIIEEKNMIIKLSVDGLDYRQIASQLDLNKSTVSSFFKGKVRKKYERFLDLL